MRINIINDEIIEALSKEKEIFWENKHLKTYQGISLKKKDIEDAVQRIKRFQPLLEKIFPELEAAKGKIISPLKEIPFYKKQNMIPGRLLLKMDSHLPISGSIKARGGIYEVLKHAESIALKHGIITIDSDYSILKTKEDFFSNYSISVGSTGNLGLSIGLMGSKLGFKVNVHMSRDAMQWKKDMLRKNGVNVIEYEEDYSHAVEEARKQSKINPEDYFIDDENSKDLFLGYSTAAYEINEQLQELGINVSSETPLFVYLPCGVGGGPGGITFGMKEMFGDNAHCFFAEPTQSPAVFLGVYTQLHDEISVRDIGLQNKTIADGLAVGKPSGFVGKTLNSVINGFYTVKDDYLYNKIKELYGLEKIFLEPSATIGFKGIDYILDESKSQNYCRKRNIKPENIIHIVWATGGSLVPENIKKEYLT